MRTNTRTHKQTHTSRIAPQLSAFLRVERAVGVSNTLVWSTSRLSCLRLGALFLLPPVPLSPIVVAVMVEGLCLLLPVRDSNRGVVHAGDVLGESPKPSRVS